MKGRTVSKTFKLIFILGVVFISMHGSAASADTLGITALNSICDPPIEVMPLGDSITVGKYSGIDTSAGADADDIGYRKDLRDLLTGVDFVGSEENGSTFPSFGDPQHEGHNGWSDDQIADNIYNNGGANWLNANPPDVILLHIGTNSLSTDPSDVEDILDEINEYEIDTGRSVIVFVARIINQVSHNTNVTIFNNNVEGMVTARPDYGSEVFMVDMEDGAGIIYSLEPAGDMFDNLHPYATGYTKMAAVWKAKYDEIHDYCGTNDPPVIDPVSDQVDDEGDTIVPLQIEPSDPDPDGDSVTYIATNLPDGLSINFTTGLISGTISYTASNGNTHHVQVTVSDGKPLGSTTIGFDWTVADTNWAPEVTTPADQTDDEGTTIDPPLQIEAIDLDGDTLVYVAVGLPPGLSIDASTGEISGTISYTASPDRTYDVTVTVTDTGDNATPVVFTWTVANRNGPPIVTPVDDRDDLEGTTLDPPLQIEASDPDGDSLQFEATNLPPGLSINENNGKISGTISHFAVMGMSSKDFLVEIIVTDIAESPIVETVEFIWTVNNVNGPPEMVNPGNQFNQVEEIISLKITTTDPDGDAYQFTENGLPPSLVIGKNTGVISGKLAELDAQSSPHTVTITATDDGTPNKSSQIDFIWVVTTGEIYLPLIFR